jgi:hypothetical protein
MIGRSSNILGIAITDRAIACAEVTVAGQRRTLRRTATFAFNDGVTLESPEAAGQALATFLRGKHFGTTRCVVGVPARWLIAVEREIPPSNETEARAALRLQAERLAVAESGEVVFDFAGAPRRNESSKVLLVGMLRPRLDAVERLMDAAGMNVLSVTSSGLALAACATAGAADGGLLALAQGGGELIWRSAGSPRMLRHVPFNLNGHGVPPTLANELRRILATAPAGNGQPADDAVGQSPAARSLLLLDEVGLGANELSELARRLGASVTSATAEQVLAMAAAPQTAAADMPDPKAPGRFAQAMALALTGTRTDLLPVDFKHSRLTPPRVRRVGKRGIWAAALAVLLIGGLLWLWLSVRSRESELNDLTRELSAMKDDVTAAQAVVDRLSIGRGYFVEASRPPMLDCLRELTSAFRDDEKLWATTITLQENGKGTLIGRAADQKTVLALLDRLKKNRHFSDVKLPGGMREADARTREVSFSMSFDFKSAE